MNAANKLPDDVMEILVPNHKKRDESLKLRQENARRILKEKQAFAAIEAKRIRDLRRKGVPMPEDIRAEQEIRKLSEFHLIEQRKKRKAMKGKKS